MSEIKKFSERIKNSEKFGIVELRMPVSDAKRLLIEIQELEKPSAPISVVELKKVIKSVSLDGGSFGD